MASPHPSVENGSDSGCNGDTGDIFAGMFSCMYLFYFIRMRIYIFMQVIMLIKMVVKLVALTLC